MATFTLIRSAAGQMDSRGREHFSIEWTGSDKNGDPCRKAQHYFMAVEDFAAMEHAKGNAVEVA